MQIKFEPSGTHIDKGNLRIRLNFYPESSDKSYSKFYVPVQTRVPTAKELDDPVLFAQIPTTMLLTPCLCHFISVPETVDSSVLTNFIQNFLSKDMIASIDTYIAQSNNAHFISPLMRDCRFRNISPVATKDVADLVETTKSSLASFAVNLSSGGIKDISPESITIGAHTATTQTQIPVARSYCDETNPSATTDGTIDTYKVTLVSWGTDSLNSDLGCVYGTGASFTSRSKADIGTISHASEQTITGLTLACNNGDKAAFYGETGGDTYLMVATSGQSGTSLRNGTFVGTNNDYSAQAGWGTSLQGTGTESGGLGIPIAEHHFRMQRQ